tara:strand:- start:183835 stop:185592 length:1758 start_codon:yes stop_codon:yes gene_type:complete
MIKTRSRIFCLAIALVAARVNTPVFAATECEDYRDGQLNLYWGDLHIHTALSLDAYAFGTTADPRDAYAFARGQELTLPDESTRIKLQRPLDFAAVTEHAETFDVMYLCTDPNYLDLPYCNELVSRAGTKTADSLYVFRNYLLPLISGTTPQTSPICDRAGIDCKAASRAQWRRIQHYANRANSPCDFTAFIGNEWSATPNDQHWHRNMIFAGTSVTEDALDYIRYPTPAKLWQELEKQCRPEEDCDVVVIPHNTNLSEGGGFDVESSPASELQMRAKYERLLEIHQSKGNSECLAENWDDTDSDCGFEKYIPSYISEQQQAAPGFVAAMNRSYARNILTRGLLAYTESGDSKINPLQMGFIGSTDNHVATPGAVDEGDWKGDAWGGGDEYRERRLQRMGYNPGGLVAVWAEQNTRENLFASLKRREVYGTSGTRIKVRFAADTAPDSDPCSAGYNWGKATPMGGTISNDRPQTQSPRFTVLAGQDTVPLSQIQIVKGTVQDGTIVETVYPLHASSKGVAHTCQTWSDPDYDASQPAYWYARVFEVPTPRWSKTLCESMENCQQVPGADRMIRERAWSSPIWYLP